MLSTTDLVPESFELSRHAKCFLRKYRAEAVKAFDEYTLPNAANLTSDAETAAGWVNELSHAVECSDLSPAVRDKYIVSIQRAVMALQFELHAVAEKVGVALDW